jgi:hypothetical protein
VAFPTDVRLLAAVLFTVRIADISSHETLCLIKTDSIKSGKLVAWMSVAICALAAETRKPHKFNRWIWFL